MTRTLRISVGDAVGVAELDDVGAPRTVEALCGLLPLEGEFLVSMWSGHAAELVLPAALAPLAGSENASIDVDVGELAIGAALEGPLLLIAYGACKFHTAIGAAPATRIGQLVDRALLEQLERTFDDGALAARLELA